MKKARSLAVVALLTGSMAGAAGPASGGQIRTDTTLGGYSVRVESAPLRIEFDDPSVPIPRPPGSAIVEADPSYTLATLDSGPTSRALSSSFWPGNLLGDGWSQVVGGIPIPGIPGTYPIKADARYPDNPHEATDSQNGAFMRASAEGLDVVATARANPGDPPGALGVASVTSTSGATVQNGVAIGTSTTHVSNFEFMSGLIKVGSVSTTLTTSSDGEKPTSSGTTVVSGLTVAGYGYSVDDKGAHLVSVPGNPGAPAPPQNTFDPLKALGITINGLTQAAQHDQTSATRTAQGLRITIDAKALRQALQPVTSVTNGPVGTIISKLPSSIPNIPQLGNPQSFAYMAYETTPKITIVLGSADGQTAATQPLGFNFPPVGFPSTDVAAPGIGTVAPPAAVTSPGGITSPTGQAPTVVTPATKPLASTGPRKGFGGLSAAFLLLAAAVAGTLGFGLVKMRDAAMATEPASSLPDLRGA